MLTTKSVMKAIINNLTTNGIATKDSVVVTDEGITVYFEVSDEYLPKCIANMHVCLIGCASTVDWDGECFAPVRAFADYLDKRDGKAHRYHEKYPIYDEVIGSAEIMNTLLGEVSAKSLYDYFDRITHCN